MNDEIQNLPLASKEDAELLLSLKKHEEAIIKDPMVDYEEFQRLASQVHHLLHSRNWYNLEFEENGKKGLKDCTGELLVPALYDDFPILWHYLDKTTVTPVKKDGLYGFFKPGKTGHLTLPCQYEDFRCWEFAKYYTVRRPGSNLVGLVDNCGTELLPCEMEDIQDVGDGSVAYKKDSKWGHAFPGTNLIVPAIFESIEYEGPDEFYVYYKDDKKGRADAEGRFYSDEEIECMSDEHLDEAKFLLSCGL